MERMAKFSHQDSRRMYSWWWDSHISPKNSKWLQENLTDMDANVKSMIKLIEEDADSFARRAEMYYKKRPELMRMVEDFYRAYRALAERYDHATGVIRHAHRRMTEAQVPMNFSDDPRTPDMSIPMGGFTDDSAANKKKSFGMVEKVRRNLNFDEMEEKEQSNGNNNHVKDINQKSDSEAILALKEALAKMEAEKEAGLVQYQQSLDKLSQLEDEMSKTREDFRVLNDHANKAEKESFLLKEKLAELEAEKESKLQEYQYCVEKVSNLQTDAEKLNERANNAEVQAESLKEQIDKLAGEKNEALNQYMQSLETISNLENKLHLTEEDSRKLKERAAKAESEVEVLKEAVSKLTEEKEAAAWQYQKCLETISNLEQKLATAQEEEKRLNLEIENRVSKLKGAEEQCLLLERSNQSLHSELESLMLKMGNQTQELTEKQTELGRLWTCIQEERLRFVEAETAFQTLQHLHAQTQEELRAMASELQNRAQLLKVAESQNRSLQDEVVKVKEDNKNLDEVNTSSALSIKDMQNEISSLMESKGKLLEEVELRVDQRNALQQEIYCLKEELSDLNKNHLSVLEENSSLKETCKRESCEKAALLEKLLILEQLREKNSLLETSLSDLNAELEAVRGKIEELERSCKSLFNEKSVLLDEKTALVKQLEETKENLGKLSENNTVLENSLSDAHRQLEALKAKSKILEDSCQLLVNEKAGLISEKDGLTSQLENTKVKLENIGKLYGKLEGRCVILEKEKESTLRRIDELQMSLDVERKEKGSYVQMNEARFSEVEAEKLFLQEECQQRKQELDEVLDNAIDNEIEIYILRINAEELNEANGSLVVKNQKLLEEYRLSEMKILQLEHHNSEQKVEIKCLSDKAEQDLCYVNQLLSKIQDLKISLFNAEEENVGSTVELSVLVTLIRQLNLASEILEMEKNKIEDDFKVRTEEVEMLERKAVELVEMNEQLRMKLKEGDCNKEMMVIQIEDLKKKLIDMQDACKVLQREKFEICEEKRSLLEKNNVLEEENYVLCDKVLDLENVSLILRSFADEKVKVLREVGDDRNKLNEMNFALMSKLSLTERKLEESRTENLHLNEMKDALEEENYVLCDKVLDLENVSLIFRSFADEKVKVLREVGDDRNKLNEMNVALMSKLSLTERKLEESRTENLHLNEMKDALVGKLSLTEGVLEESKTENHQLNEMKDALMGKLSLTEGELEESRTENIGLKERLQKTEDDFTIVATVKDELSHEIENGKKLLHQMALQLQEAEEKINLIENEKLELSENMEDLKNLHEYEILKLSADNDNLSGENNFLHEAIQKLEVELRELQGEHNKSKIQEENLKTELKTKTNEIDELESRAASVFGQLQYFMVSQILYEQKFSELNDKCLGYIDQNEGLRSQLAAYGPEIASLKECISSLENHADIHIKFQNPENDELKDAQITNDPCESMFSDLRDQRIRLQAIAKAAVEMKELMVQENTDLHSKLEASLKQLNLLQSESGQYYNRRNRRNTSEITEENNTLLTKDIVLDQISDSSSYGYSKRREPADADNQIHEIWETSDPDGTVGLTVGKTKKVSSEIRRVRSMRKQKDLSVIEKDLSVDKLEISKSVQEGNKRRVLERLDSDVQKLANLQITVQDLKRKLDVTEKGKRGKAVIECEALKGQLEEADIAVMKLFELNGRLMKSIDADRSFSDVYSSSFDLEGEGSTRKRRVSEQARRMSEKIGRLQLEVQKLQFVLLKLDDGKEGKEKMSESKRRVLLRDYLYGGGRHGQRRKKGHFCACVQPSTKD